MSNNDSGGRPGFPPGFGAQPPQPFGQPPQGGPQPGYPAPQQPAYPAPQQPAYPAPQQPAYPGALPTPQPYSPQSGGYPQQPGAPGPVFGQPPQPTAPPGFGSQQGLGQPPPPQGPPGQSGWGTPQPQQAGLGQQPGGFGQAPPFGFGQPAQPNFGQSPPIGFGSPPSGFGTPMQGGFGQQPVAPGAGAVFAGGAAFASGVGKIARARRVGRIAGLGLALVIGAVIAVAAWWSHEHPSVRFVNLTGKDGVTVTMDGEVIASNLKNAGTENASLVTAKSIASGKHKFEAKDSSGKVLESVTQEIRAGSHGYVFAPARNKQLCLIVQTDEYGTGSVGSLKDHYKPLDPSKTFWELPEKIDYFFQDTPSSIQQKKGSSSVIKRALRQARCDDRTFQD